MKQCRGKNEGGAEPWSLQTFGGLDAKEEPEGTRSVKSEKENQWAAWGTRKGFQEES